MVWGVYVGAVTVTATAAEHGGRESEKKTTRAANVQRGLMVV